MDRLVREDAEARAVLESWRGLLEALPRVRVLRRVRVPPQRARDRSAERAVRRCRLHALRHAGSQLLRFEPGEELLDQVARDDPGEPEPARGQRVGVRLGGLAQVDGPEVQHRAREHAAEQQLLAGQGDHGRAAAARRCAGTGGSARCATVSSALSATCAPTGGSARPPGPRPAHPSIRIPRLTTASPPQGPTNTPGRASGRRGPTASRPRPAMTRRRRAPGTRPAPPRIRAPSRATPRESRAGASIPHDLRAAHRTQLLHCGDPGHRRSRFVMEHRGTPPPLRASRRSGSFALSRPRSCPVGSRGSRR